MAAKIGYKMFRIEINKKKENEGWWTSRLVWTNIKELLYLGKIKKISTPSPSWFLMNVPRFSPPCSTYIFEWVFWSPWPKIGRFFYRYRKGGSVWLFLRKIANLAALGFFYGVFFWELLGTLPLETPLEQKVTYTTGGQTWLKW